MNIQTPAMDYNHFCNANRIGLKCYNYMHTCDNVSRNDLAYFYHKDLASSYVAYVDLQIKGLTFLGF